MEESPSGAGSHKRTRPVEAAGAADAQTRPPRLGKHCAFSPSFHRALPHHKHTQRKTRKSTGHWASWSPFSQFRTHMNFRRAIFLRRRFRALRPSALHVEPGATGCAGALRPRDSRLRSAARRAAADRSQAGVVVGQIGRHMVPTAPAARAPWEDRHARLTSRGGASLS